MLNNKSEIYAAVKNMTLEELASIFTPTKKIETVEHIDKTEKTDSKILYTINELIENYPFFTRYNINKAIQNDGLPYCFIGNKRMFSKNEIDKWLEKETSQKKEKLKYDI